MFTDSSFPPAGARTHGTAVVTYKGTPICRADAKPYYPRRQHVCDAAVKWFQRQLEDKAPAPRAKEQVCRHYKPLPRQRLQELVALWRLKDDRKVRTLTTETAQAQLPQSSATGLVGLFAKLLLVPELAPTQYGCEP